MAFQVVFEGIMEWRMLRLQDLWMKREDMEEVHIFGAGIVHKVLHTGENTKTTDRSVHNIRIERLWVDFTQGIGSKWKNFFQDLEATSGLDVDNVHHIWLLHFLFLEILCREVHGWAEAWNNHRMSTVDHGMASPHEMRFFSMLQHGARGFQDPLATFQPMEEFLGDDQAIAEYGIDWDDIENNHIRTHHDTANHVLPHNLLGNNPFVAYTPETLNNVQVDEPNCPLTPQQLMHLQEAVRQFVDDGTILAWRRIWEGALALCIHLLSIVV
jgi:hypothetical protein